MRFLSNAHTHSTFCDGKNPPEEMIRAAERLGFVSLGFSGHACQGFDWEYSMTAETQKAYLETVRALGRTAKLRVWAGLEQDTFAPEMLKAENRRMADYVIGSAHYVRLDFHGGTVAVDGDPALLRQYVHEECGGDGLELARQYFDVHASGLLRDRPDVIGHFDLVRKYALSEGILDENSAEYRRLALDALEKAFPCGGVLEVNTGAIARGYRDDPYPTAELLAAWREMGGRATITSDCHDAAKLDCAFERAVELLRQTGYRTVLRLGTGEERWQEEKL